MLLCWCCYITVEHKISEDTVKTFWLDLQLLYCLSKLHFNSIILFSYKAVIKHIYLAVTFDQRMLSFLHHWKYFIFFLQQFAQCFLEWEVELLIKIIFRCLNVSGFPYSSGTLGIKSVIWIPVDAVPWLYHTAHINILKDDVPHMHWHFMDLEFGDIIQGKSCCTWTKGYRCLHNNSRISPIRTFMMCLW